jgi:hypothetical protein
VQVKTEVSAAEQKIKEMLQKANADFLDEKPNDTADAPDQKVEENDADAIRRAAIRDLTSLTTKIEQAQQSDKAMESALKEAMEQLKQPGPGAGRARGRQKGERGEGGASCSVKMSDDSLNKLKEPPSRRRTWPSSSQARSRTSSPEVGRGAGQEDAQDLAKKAADSVLKDAMDKLPLSERRRTR